MESVRSSSTHWKLWLPSVWFWGNILYLASLTLVTLVSIHHGEVGPKKINKILKRWITVAALLLLRELLEPIMAQLQQTWLLLTGLGTLCFLENLKQLNSTIFEYVINPILNNREQKIDLFLHRLSFHYLEWKTAFLQLVAYCSSELLRRTAHYLVADTELSRKLSSMETGGDHSPSPHRGIYEKPERKFLPRSYTDPHFSSFSKREENVVMDNMNDTHRFDTNNSMSQPCKSLRNRQKPYERIHELRMLFRQQKSRRSSTVSEKGFG
ncbi:hypothetical protein Gasu2_44130 [Galdieria sulphuraria]|uniref:Uncharacterized protein n=1 Tax=Galdieria sulphuraria TaxID=130081 RepID=M2X4Y7_GALSU|nr:uncharacterized protein Gasu_12140 [Galdieria sulphuraria]EME31540.1 hypothetical protein Gasu_12140 [Galdieria sulphuraria]GJD10205.1 hypothetical protein Gasu2_44130 [Galdieria sulphuraria]|eukprot:XP_005708060.1 hypothetical protein Gasu_12140 [Galdieria sulphuraria]